MLEWTTRAKADADDILLHIATEASLNRALLVLDEIIAHLDVLLDQPNIGRIGRVEGTREFVLSGLPYIVIYRVDGDNIEITRVLHGAQQWPS